MTGVWDQPGHPGVTRHAPIACRICGLSNDAFTNARGTLAATPAGGDVTICVGCGEVSVLVLSPLGDALTFREPTLTELEKIRADHGDALEGFRRWREHGRRKP